MYCYYVWQYFYMQIYHQLLSGVLFKNSIYKVLFSCLKLYRPFKVYSSPVSNCRVALWLRMARVLSESWLAQPLLWPLLDVPCLFIGVLTFPTTTFYFPVSQQTLIRPCILFYGEICTFLNSPVTLSAKGISCRTCKLFQSNIKLWIITTRIVLVFRSGFYQSFFVSGPYALDFM